MKVPNKVCGIWRFNTIKSTENMIHSTSKIIIQVYYLQYSKGIEFEYGNDFEMDSEDLDQFKLSDEDDVNNDEKNMRDQ